MLGSTANARTLCQQMATWLTVTRSNRVGCASFPFLYSAICAPGPKLQLCLIRASKKSGGKSSPSADSLATRLALKAVVRADAEPFRDAGTKTLE
jgi:hypothetical protein